MPIRLPDVDFHRIRGHGQPPTLAGGFEELSSLLIQQGVVEWPPDTRFERFGVPDGGREGKGTLPNGDVWAWQSKYLFEFDSSAAAQVTSSIRRVLDQEPNLKRYFVTMPLNLPGGDTTGRRSATTRWKAKVADWEKLSQSRGLKVEFEFVGEHRLLTALTEPRHEGRARYWFNVEVLSPDWQARHVEAALLRAGPRYTAQVHVNVDTVSSIAGAGRDESYVVRWRRALAALREARQWSWRAPDNLADVFDEKLPACDRALDELDRALTAVIAAVSSVERLPSAEVELARARQALREVDDALHEHALSSGGYFVGEAASLYSNVSRAWSALRQAEDVSEAVATQAADRRALLLTGRAGVGKSHLLCDEASRRTTTDKPTVLLLGQDFDGTNLLDQFGRRAQLGSTLHDVLVVLDAAAEARACVGLLLLDALNESERPDRWEAAVRELLGEAARFPNVGVVIACRTEFLDRVVGTVDIPTIEHQGFGEATDTAVRRYAHEYGLEPPTFPVLNPEFDNPLFLKLTCEALRTLGATRFPFGSAGLTKVCESFLDAVNLRLAARADYDPSLRLVHLAVREIALSDASAIDRDEIRQITESLLPGRTYSLSLMAGLLAEGVLIERWDGSLTFGYQRLGDVARAAVLAEGTTEDVAAWLVSGAGTDWRQRGVVGALAVIVPELHQAELIDLSVDDAGHVSHDALEAFLESLLLRSPTSVGQRAIEVIERMQELRYRPDDIWDRLVRLACVPDHPLNATWLHRRLGPLATHDRDVIWSSWLVGILDEEEKSSVLRLVDWAWPRDTNHATALPDEVAKLATLTLGWLLTSSDRRVRDRATKALVSIGERGPVGFAQGVARFRGTNDPYVTERLAAAACGVALRTTDIEAIRTTADAVRQLIGEESTTDLLVRDYVRRTFDIARKHGWEGPDYVPPYGAAWPIAARSRDEIDALAGPPDYSYGSVWGSISGGDFGRYVIQPALRNFATKAPRALQDSAEQFVFDRVLELGWTPARFGDIDRSRGGRDGSVERIGKKYQWIGLHEVLGRLADHHRVRHTWRGRSVPYERPEQVLWRDIDPTVLVRKPAEAQSGRPWFSPATARFPRDLVDSYPADMEGVPDPLDSICISDVDGHRWLTLMGSPEWEQPLPPEIEALRVPQRHISMHIQAFLVPTRNVKGVREWADGTDWRERGLPEAPSAHSALLGSYPDGPGWAHFDGNPDPWDVRTGKTLRRLKQCAAWYGGTGTSRDASAERETVGYLPTRRLISRLGLVPGVDFRWADSHGLAVWDPSVLTGGPATLIMARRTTDRLLSEGWTLLWATYVSSDLRSNDMSIPGDTYRWVGASASYLLAGDFVELIGAQAARFAAGPAVEHSIAWAPRDSA